MSFITDCNKGKAFKVCIVGDSRVGKSCIASRLVNNMFSVNTTTTIGSAYMLKEMNVDGEACYLNIWDTAGQERFRALAPLYYRDASAIVLVYDITKERSFENLRTIWLPALRNCTQNDLVLAVVGNKLDLQDKERLITTEEARGYTDILDALFSETSAKTGENVTEIFTEIVRKVREVKKKSAAAVERPTSVIQLPGSTSIPKTGENGSVSDGANQQKHRSGCRCNTQ